MRTGVVNVMCLASGWHMRGSPNPVPQPFTTINSHAATCAQGPQVIWARIVDQMVFGPAARQESYLLADIAMMQLQLALQDDNVCVDNA